MRRLYMLLTIAALGIESDTPAYAMGRGDTDGGSAGGAGARETG